MKFKSNYLEKYKNDVNGFGLTESILSILLLAILVAYSTLFITKRLQTNYRANLTDAINDEIKRDIQKLKYELWKSHLVISNNPSVTTSYYDVKDSNKRAFCNDISNTLALLPSWNPSSWIPNGNPGQLKNNVFKGAPVTISREFITQKPFQYGGSGFDNSITKIAYKVRFNGAGGSGFIPNASKYWTSIDMTSEAYGWCPAK